MKILRGRPAEGLDSTELRELEDERARNPRTEIRRRARRSRGAPPVPTKKRGWDPNTIRNEVEGEFRAAGACVVREEKTR